MITKAQVKLLRSLDQKKYRDEHGLFIAEGPKIVNELLKDFKAQNIFGTKEYVSSGGQQIDWVTENELEQISLLTSPNKVVGVFEIPVPKLNVDLLKEKLVLALDDIRDPGNFGTIVRIADWFGICHILCSESCVDVYNPKVVQATMGSIARVEVRYLNLEDTLSNFDPVYGAVLNGENIYTEKLSSNGLIVIGNESKGISSTLLKYVTRQLSIPSFGKADSLNAAIATAIICSEFKRR